MKIVIALSCVAAAYVAVLAVLYFGQRVLLFPAPRAYLPPSAVGVSEVVEAPMTMAAGVRLMIWRMEAEPGQPTVLYFHGNGDSVSNQGDLFEFWRRQGWGGVVVSYRGYPGSTGRPSEAALVDDALAVFDALVDEGLAPGDLILAGTSLGSGVATALAAQRRARALYLSGAFTAVDELAAKRFPIFPVRLLMKDPFRSIERMGAVEMPVFMVHGTADRVVPFAMGRRLFQAAGEPKTFVELPDAGHVLPVEPSWGPFASFLQTHGADGSVGAR